MFIFGWLDQENEKMRKNENLCKKRKEHLKLAIPVCLSEYAPRTIFTIINDKNRNY
jgi:hypothetical protein